MRTRIEFRNMLAGVVGDSVKLYFQPPEGEKLKYPCIVYGRGTPITRHANDEKYLKLRNFDVLLIVADAEDTELSEKLEDIKYSRPGKPYMSDRLYHYPFSIYY